jgi:HD-like signal output (HDOD) protein
MPVTKGIDLRLLSRLPAFSPIAVQLLSMLADEDVSFKEVARLIALDPVLAAQVLRLANSGLYGRRTEVSSVLQAISFLGMRTLSHTAVTAALWRGLPHRTTPFVRAWWRHSIAAALIAQHITHNSPVDLAYTAALLHGVGQLALFQDAPVDYPNLVERACIDGLDLREREHETFGTDHAALAGLILEFWGLPEKLCGAAAKHHDDSAGSRLVLAVQNGCAGAEYAGFGRCGCHQRLGVGAPGPPAELLAGDYLAQTLINQINEIECSLG